MCVCVCMYSICMFVLFIMKIMSTKKSRGAATPYERPPAPREESEEEPEDVIDFDDEDEDEAGEGSELEIGSEEGGEDDQAESEHEHEDTGEAAAGGEEQSGANEGEEDAQDADEAGELPDKEEEVEGKPKKKEKRGILYLSRIPPYMRPEKVRHLLSQFGKVDRVYLKPEDEEKRRRRMKLGGKRKRKYTEGWVEFISKRIAKRVAESLNGRPIGGRGFHSEDIWCLKYLTAFKWHHLTEKIAYDNASRRARLDLELSQVRRETEHFKEQADKAASAARRLKRAAAAGEAGQATAGVGMGVGGEGAAPARTIRQRLPLAL
eukprot:m.6031 g.6031  ORF g.6031 m.6031 type:complete len:321 (-) comp4670_c0_seq1:258-1220(-)